MSLTGFKQQIDLKINQLAVDTVVYGGIGYLAGSIIGLLFRKAQFGAYLGAGMGSGYVF
jgi:uncharacterized membrane protein